MKDFPYREGIQPGIDAASAAKRASTKVSPEDDIPWQAGQWKCLRPLLDFAGLLSRVLANCRRLALRHSLLDGDNLGEDHLEARRRARRLLARMERMEQHAQQAVGERPFPSPNLAEQQIACFQAMYQNTYRRLVGVDPSAREALRAQLHEIEAGADRTIEEAIARVRHTIEAGRVLETPLDQTG